MLRIFLSAGIAKTKLPAPRRLDFSTKYARRFSKGAPEHLPKLEGHGFLAYTINISSWFQLPEQGMQQEELLSRGSAFLVPVQTQDSSEVHIFTSGHVVHPFAFPHYYAKEMEWLQFVQDHHVTCRLEARDAGGRIIYQELLRSRVFRHQKRDLAVLHPVDHEALLSQLTALDRRTVQLGSDAPGEGDALHFFGHFKVESDPEQSHVPEYVKGTLVGRGGGYTFCATEKELQMGMCGGPVLNEAGECVGMIEAIVAGTSPLKGHAVVIEKDVLSEFMAETEQGLSSGSSGDGIVWD